MMKKRILSLFLTVTLMLTVGVLPAHATFATATTIALQDYEGDISVRNSWGIPLLAGWVSTLYNGYTVETEGGYAWILLDDTQLVKMGNDTKITLKKTSGQTEVLVDYGEVLFVVTETLEPSASLTIRTSTMSTGVRGTAGLVTVTPPQEQATQVSYLSLFEGSVRATAAEEVERTITTYDVVAGEQIMVREDEGNEGALLVEYTQENVVEELASKGFVATELKDNEAFQEKMMEVITEEELEEISGSADATQSSQEEAATAEREEQQEVATALADEVTADTSSSSSSSSGSSYSGNSSSGDSSSDDSDSSSDSDSAVVACTVTYWYGEVKFAQVTVEVTDTATAPAPTLTPTERGYWAREGETYAFDTVLTEETLTLTWVTVTADT